VNNYEFCASFAAERGARVLDYGCGKGAIVELLLQRHIDAYGCDVFYEGGDYSSDIPAVLEGDRIKRMDGNTIPFPDGYFDVVVHNQVFEHVADLDVVLAEIARVLKPNGVMLALFPDDRCWREGHCGIPFLHWFEKGSTLRVYYAFMVRSFGFGYFHGNRSRMEWARNFCQWLDKWTFYRPYEQIRASLQPYFSVPRHIEGEWFDARKPYAKVLPEVLKQHVARRMAGLVFWCERK
jgi:SAM-dependent methyltransferase